MAVLADVHVGNHQLFGGTQHGGLNDRCRETVRILSHAIRGAAEDGAHMCIIAGDLFDSDLPSPAIISAVQHAIGAKNLVRGTSMRVVVLNGNHDMTSTDMGHTAVSPLGVQPGVIVIESSLVLPITQLADASVVLVPHRPGPAKEWLAEELASLFTNASARPKLLALHLGIEHDGTPPWLRGSDDSIHVSLLAKLCRQHRIDHVVSGNWHAAWADTVDGVHIRQVGALVPTGFDNPGIRAYGRVVNWEYGGGPAEFVPDTILYGPRFTRVSNLTQLDELASYVSAHAGEDTHYVSAELPEHEYFAGLLLLEKLRDSNQIVQFKMSKPIAEVRAKAERAAKAATDAGNLGASLFDYIVEMDLQEDQVDRHRLHQECRRLLKLSDTCPQ